jgi:hypothetical protein
MPITDFQPHSVICFCVLRHKFNYQIQTKLCFIYNKDALYPRTMDIWAAWFRSGRTSVEDDKRRGKPSRDDFLAAASDYLERNPHASCCEINKGMFILRITILWVLGEIGFRFVIAMSVPHERSIARAENEKVEICQEIPEVLEEIGSQQKNRVIMGNKCMIYWNNCYHGQ